MTFTAGASVPSKVATQLSACDAAAYAALPRPLPADMPAINFPRVDHCDTQECARLKTWWLLAHHHIWQIVRRLDYIASLDHVDKRRRAWANAGRDANGVELGERYTARYWFGPFHDGRLAAIRGVFNDLLDTFRTNQHGASELRLQCTPSWDVGNFCNYDDPPAANHVPVGRVTFCDSVLGVDCNAAGSAADRTDCWERRLKTMIHEPLHWRSVSWKDDGGFHNRFLTDQHLHGHGATCLSGLKSQTMYGEARAHHLASYRRAGGKRCNHLAHALSNLDNYALYASVVGTAIYLGQMTQWPWPVYQSPNPTPHPPDPKSCTAGEEGCLCAPLDPYWSSPYGRPDGDYRSDRVCHDHDGVMTCAATRFNAAETVGICTSCEGPAGAAGCECETTDDCASGLSCFGSDTANGYGTGRCYDATPPSWVCAADCQALFNDEQAYCDEAYPGGAHCFDSSCSAPKNEQCRLQGKVCRYGACEVECGASRSCADLGYPGIFKCVSGVCRR